MIAILKKAGEISTNLKVYIIHHDSKLLAIQQFLKK